MTLNIRPMKESDIDAVYAIESTAHITPWGRDILRDCVLVGYDCKVLEVIEQQQTSIVGYIISRFADGECHLLNICIANSMQAKGYGHAFLTIYLTSLSYLPHIHSVALEVRPSNIIALHLYGAAGFKQIERKMDYYKDANGTEDAIVLKKIINPRENSI